MCQLSSNLITLFKLIISTASECKYKEKSSSVRNLIDMKLEEDGDCKKEAWAKTESKASCSPAAMATTLFLPLLTSSLLLSLSGC